MRPIWLALILAGLTPAVGSAQGAPRPVVVELFTSQGCSSCPPADALVAGLAASHLDLLPLTFHVTYWNNLGWQDPFSFTAATERQEHYLRLGVAPEIYTPAMVVDGRIDVIGSDRAAVDRSIARATAQAQTVAPIDITRDGTTLSIAVGPGPGTEPHHATILLIGYDPQHETHVGRGENSGRTLLEANIVRSMTVVGTWTGQPLHLRTGMPFGEQVAVIVQSDDGGILGAAKEAKKAVLF